MRTAECGAMTRLSRGAASSRREPTAGRRRARRARTANLLRVADQLFRNSFVNDAVFKTMAARYDTCNVMDAGMTVADVASIALLYNTLGVQPDEVPAADRMPMDIPYKVDVPQRETVTLKAPRAVPMPGKGANNPRTFGLTLGAKF